MRACDLLIFLVVILHAQCYNDAVIEAFLIL